MWTSFATSPSSRRVTGIPVQVATTSATSSASTSSLRKTVAPARRDGLLALGELLLELGDDPVAKLGGALEVGGALGALDLAAGGLELLLGLGDRADRVLLGLPLRLHRGRALALLGELALERRAALRGGVVGLLGERGQLDLELHHAAVDLVDLGRQRVDLDAQARGGLVDEVDRLVGQEAVGDVAVRELGGGDQRACPGCARRGGSRSAP